MPCRGRIVKEKIVVRRDRFHTSQVPKAFGIKKHVSENNKLSSPPTGRDRQGTSLFFNPVIWNSGNPELKLFLII